MIVILFTLLLTYTSYVWLIYVVATCVSLLQFKDINTAFFELVDKLAAQLHTVDVGFLADKCRTLMASDVHNIKLFTNSFIMKLFMCSHPSLLKIYLLPFVIWLDKSVLTELATAYEKGNVLELLYRFAHTIDHTESITSYPIPTFSQLIIPLDNSEYTIVATEILQNCTEFILRDVINLKEFLTDHWELTAHALHLVAIDYHYNCMYWMISKQVKTLVEDKLSQGQHELQHKGIYMTVVLPNNFFSFINKFDRQMINSPFNVSLKDSMEVRVAVLVTQVNEQLLMLE